MRALVALGVLGVSVACARDARVVTANAHGATAIEATGRPNPVSTATSRAVDDTAPPTAAPNAPDDAPSAIDLAGPQIYAATASPSVVHAGESLAISVRTSPDVATVTASVSAYALPLVRMAPGRFELRFTIPPNVPGFFHGTYAMQMEAKDKSGSRASRSVDVTFQ